MSNEVLEEISKREFGENELIIGGIKKGKIHLFAGTTKKKDLDQHMLRLRGILKE